MIHSYMSRNIKYMAIDSQVCLHRQLFTDPANCISALQGLWRYREALIRIGGMSDCCQCVSTYSVGCVHHCQLPQHHCLCHNGRENLPLACLPTPTPPRPLPIIHLLIDNTHDITGVAKYYLKYQQ